MLTEKQLKIAGISEMKIQEILAEGSLETVLYKIDKWMPSEEELQNEFYEITDPKELADFFANNADEGVMRRYGFNGNWLALAKLELANRK